MKVLYIHDFEFCHVENSSYTAVGMPEIYFDRFFDSGAEYVDIVSRGKEGVVGGYVEICNSRIRFPLRVDARYLRIFNPLFFVRAINCVFGSDLVVINTPSIVGFYFLIICSILKRNYVIEFAADLDQFEKKKGGRWVTFLYKTFIKFFLSRAMGATYVGKFLYEKYPVSRHKFFGSNVVLFEVSSRAKSVSINCDVFNVCFVGSLTERKGVRDILKAVRLLKDNVKDKCYRFHFIGGHSDCNWNEIVDDYRIEDCVIFHGILNPSEVRSAVIKNDLYVQPSYAEGLPRATIEAMSCGIPVLTTDLEGFKELVDSDCMVPVGNSVMLAEKIDKISHDAEMYSFYAERCLERSKEYLYESIHSNRVLFYKAIYDEI